MFLLCHVPRGSILLRGYPTCSDLPKYKRAAPDFSDFLQTRQQFRFGVWCMRATLRGVPLLAREGHICVRGALPRRYNHLVGPWSCRLVDLLLGLSKTPLSVLRVLPVSNLGGERWSQIGLSMGEIALIQSRRMWGPWGSMTSVTSSCSYCCGMSCAARRYYLPCRPHALVVREIDDPCYNL